MRRWRRRAAARRDPDDQTRCRSAYEAAKRLGAATADKFGGLSYPNPGVSHDQLYAAWHRVADAWEVAHDACLEYDPDGYYAQYARAQHQNIIAAMRGAFEPREDARSDLQIARSDLRRARRYLARDGFDSDAEQWLASAAGRFQLATRTESDPKRREEAAKQAKIVRRLLRTLGFRRAYRRAGGEP